MSIEELVNHAYTSWAHDKGTSWTDHMRAALTEQAETHAIELRAYEATVQNLVEGIRQMEGELAESQKRIRQLAAEHERKQALLLEAHCERVSSLQERIRELEALMVPGGWIKCSDRLPEPYQHVVGLWRYANGVTEMEVTLYECDGEWFEDKTPEYWCAFPAAPAPKKEGE